MEPDKGRDFITPVKTPFHLTGLGITILSLITAGIALPFLIWARGPKTPNRRNWIIGITAISITALMILGANQPPVEDSEQQLQPRPEQGKSEQKEESPKPEVTVNQGPETMPRLTDMNLADARSAIASLRTSVSRKETDLISSRGIWAASNWTVVRQSPRPGATITDGSLVCLGVVQNDETWQTPDRLECWQKAPAELRSIEDFDLLRRDLLRLSGLPASLTGMHIRAELEVQMDRSSKFKLKYCTDTPISGRSADLKIDPRQGGSLVGMYDAERYLSQAGKSTYRLVGLEKSATSGCTP